MNNSKIRQPRKILTALFVIALICATLARAIYQQNHLQWVYIVGDIFLGITLCCLSGMSIGIIRGRLAKAAGYRWKRFGELLKLVFWVIGLLFGLFIVFFRSANLLGFVR